MPWTASIVYAQATPRLRALLADDPELGPELHHLRDMSHGTWPKGRALHGLPPGGLLAARGVGPPDHRVPPEIPWDALRGPPALRLGFPEPAAVAAVASSLRPHEWPPPAALRRLKHLSREAGGPVTLYRCEMWGGDIDLEAAWVPGWAPGEPDRVLAFVGPGQIAEAVAGRVRVRPGDVLQAMLEFHRLRLPSPFFLPHTGRFDWDAYRLSPAIDPPPVWRGEAPPAFPASLYRCVERGELAGAAALLAAGADPNAYGLRAPIEVAAGLGRPDLVALLLQHGAAVREALYEVRDEASARLLLAAGAALARVEPRHSPLGMAAGRGDDAVARLFVARGASLELAGDPSLWRRACEGGLVWLIDELLARGAEVDASRSSDPASGPLALACAGGHAAAAERLLAAGATPDEATWRAACRGGSEPLVALHLARGFSPDARAYEVPVLQVALKEGHEAVARRLLAAGADPMSPGPTGDTALHVAARAGLVDVLRDMLADAPAGALEARGWLGQTPLFAAVDDAHADAAALLLAAGARTDVVDAFGRGLREQAAARGLTLPG